MHCHRPPRSKCPDIVHFGWEGREKRGGEGPVFGGRLWNRCPPTDTFGDLDGIFLLGYQKGCFLTVGTLPVKCQEATQWPTQSPFCWTPFIYIYSCLTCLYNLSDHQLESRAGEQCHRPVVLVDFGFINSDLLEKCISFDRQLGPF